MGGRIFINRPLWEKDKPLCPQPSPVAVGRRCIHLRPPRHSPYAVDSLSYPVKNPGVIRCYKPICTYCMQVYYYIYNIYIHPHLWQNMCTQTLTQISFLDLRFEAVTRLGPGRHLKQRPQLARLLEKDRQSAGGHGLPRAVLS